MWNSIQKSSAPLWSWNHLEILFSFNQRKLKFSLSLLWFSFKPSYLFYYFIFIYLIISQTQIYTIINTSYKFKQKYVCRWPVENQNMSCRQAPLNIDIMSMKNFWSLLYDPPAENMHYRGHCYLDLKLIIIISSIQFRY